MSSKEQKNSAIEGLSRLQNDPDIRREVLTRAASTPAQSVARPQGGEVLSHVPRAVAALQDLRLLFKYVFM